MEFAELIDLVNTDHRVARELFQRLPELISAGPSEDVTFDLGTLISVPSIQKLQQELSTGGLAEVKKDVNYLNRLSNDNSFQLSLLAREAGREIVSPYYNLVDFEDDAKSTDVMYRARAGDMLSFPFTAFNRLPFQRKYDTQGARVGPILMPPYTEETENKYSSNTAYLNAAQYPAFTRTVTGYRRVWVRRYYGWYYSWWRYYYRYYWSSYVTSYTYKVTKSLSGSMTAQTFQVPQNRVLLGITLPIYAPGTYKAAAKPKILVFESKEGKPSLEGSILATGTLVENANAALTGATAYTCTWQLDRPVVLEANTSYGFVIQVDAAWHVYYSANQHSLGGVFYTQDGKYFQSDLAKDLSFGLVVANFGEGTTRFEIELDSVSLDGGIASMDSQYQVDKPTGTDFNLLVSLNNGVDWQDMSVMDEVESLPPFTPIKAVFETNNQYSMPLLDLTLSELTAFRPDKVMRYFTKPKPVSEGRKMLVTYNLAGFNPTYNEFVPQLRRDVDTYLDPTVITMETSDDASVTKVDAIFQIPSDWDVTEIAILCTTKSENELFNVINISVGKD